jgi:hypothetical protein
MCGCWRSTAASRATGRLTFAINNFDLIMKNEKSQKPEIFNREVNIGFSLENSERKIIGVKERENGDLVIVPNRAEHYREKNMSTSDDAPKILHQKYSVHRSLKSANDINTLTHILELSDGKKIETSHYTQAIKRFRRFAPIFAALSPSLTSENYILKTRNEDNLIIGTHHPETSLFFI